ncbi:possible anti-sigma factor [Flavobacteriales bacterium ALC-1]|nr:possible anti-sigma factor [Flavobacteriales bacterium ALC-1]
MEKHYSDESFLARWISGDLTSEELKEFKASSDYEEFVKINNVSQKLSTPQFKKAEAFKNLEKQIDSTHKAVSKTRRLKPYLLYGMAASVILLLGYFLFFNTTESFDTDFGEQLAITLPDNSQVILNSKSSISYDKNKWDEGRTLQLSGEAYFKVEEGSDFIVKTEKGNVTVLGTEFNVNTGVNYFEIQCFKGSVKVVTSNNNETILTKGKAIRELNNKIENWDLTLEIPTWTTNESTFEVAPLEQVIKALEHQYNVKVDASKVDLNQRYTGSFTHSDINLALQSIFTPMEISYLAEDNRIQLLKK